jgi:hypothetical protein
MSVRPPLPIACAWVLAWLATLAPADARAGQESTAPALTTRIDGQLIAAAGASRPADHAINPGNATFQLPRHTLLGEVRLDARVEAGRRWQLVLRPRGRRSLYGVAVGGGAAQWHGESMAEVTEAFVNWQALDAVSVTYGLQNFQWGPAELISPSNRLFHVTGVFRDPLFLVRGRHLLRVNLTAGRQWSVVAMVEPGATSEAPFRAGARFRRAVQSKIEYTSPSGGAYAALAAGARGGEPPWAGGYASVELPAGLAVYVDASAQRGSQAWYPVDTPGRPVLATSNRHRGMRALALSGLRYTRSAAFDARLELLRNTSGYTRSQGEAAAGIAEGGSPDALERWLDPGLEFLGRDLALVSVSGRDLPPADRLDVQARYVRSFTDRSGTMFVTASLETGDAVVVFVSAMVPHGRDGAEFTRLARAAAVAGLVWSF